jgi:enoyl-CoA hydratase/carnithine racemase
VVKKAMGLNEKKGREVYRDITVDRSEEIGVISLNRPEKFNAFTDNTVREIILALRELEDDEQVRVVLIKAKGPSFCSGHDFNEILKNTSSLEHRVWLGEANLENVMHRMTKPVIAVVQGLAAAGGVSLIASCDLVVASEEAKFSTPGINFGLACMLPAAEASRWMSRRKALELLLTGDSIDAFTAERVGLINKVVPRETLEEASLELARKIASKSPVAVKLAKESFYLAVDLDLEKMMACLRDMMAINAASEDVKEGITSFIEKRTPTWKGR